jgi:UDPglucose 6-dehydrogenase
MNITILGTGYVGLPTGVGFAELGHNVSCFDIDASKINTLKAGQLTIYEPGLREVFLKNIHMGRLAFTTDIKDCVEKAEIVIVAVATPTNSVTGATELCYVENAIKDLACHLNGYTIIAIKSTVPVGTGDNMEKLVKNVNNAAEFDLVSLPEFLREGFALYDFFHPERIVIGANSQKASEIMEKLYSAFKNKTYLHFVKRRSAELIKYASNSFLAIKVHYINEISDFCELAGADIDEVAKGIGLDSRIGSRFLQPGPGFGGSCFPKDTVSLLTMARQQGVHLSLVEAAVTNNIRRKKKLAGRIMKYLTDTINPCAAILGLTFKANTDDIRDSPAIEIVEELLKYGVRLQVFDPKGVENAKKILGSSVYYAKDIYDAANNASIIAILTEWEDFKNMDITKLNVKEKVIIDFRNILDKEKIMSHGFTYRKLGDPID